MISIIVPVYNVEKYLPDCMSSILAQTVDDAEIILVDDGSTDNCGVLCDQYAKRFGNVIVIHQKNAGLSAARNAGIKKAKGDFIAFVDSDDMLAEGFIKSALELARIHQSDLVAFSNVRCEADDHWPHECPKNENPKVSIYEEQVQKMHKYLFGSEIGTAAWAKVYRRELFETIRYPVGKYYEDVFTTYKVVDKAYSVVTTSQIGYIYRKTPNSILTSCFSEKRLNCVEGKMELLAFIQKNYPSLQKEAEPGVIYACNQCLKLMAQVGYKNRKVLADFQVLYRKYGKSYFKSPEPSLKGKILACIAMVNVGMARSLLGVVV